MKLTAPRLFQQSSEGVIDLQTLNPPDPGNQGDEGDPVVVSILLPDSQENQVTVWMGDVSKTFPVMNARRLVIDCAFLRSELPPLGNVYDVSYEYGGQRSPAVDIRLIDSMAPFVPRHMFVVEGVYPAGSMQSPSVISVWSIPSFRLLLKNDPIIEPFGANPAADVALKLVWKPFGVEGIEVGDIAFDAGLAKWRVNLSEKCLTLQRSDLILVQSIVARTQTLGFSLLL
ncbi:MAG TPA: hypothetical protein VF446_05215 [Trinickia sp.]